VHDPNAWAMGGSPAAVCSRRRRRDALRADAARRLARAQRRAAPGCWGASRRASAAGESDWALGWDTPTAGASSAGRHFSENSIGHLGFTGTSLWIDLDSEAVVVMLTNRVHQVAKRSRFELRPLIHDLVREAFAAG
jgi:CubicO group peptidase (beta-lactamase class C family)